MTGESREQLVGTKRLAIARIRAVDMSEPHIKESRRNRKHNGRLFREPSFLGSSCRFRIRKRARFRRTIAFEYWKHLFFMNLNRNRFILAIPISVRKHYSSLVCRRVIRSHP
jgi:hypothetical protein